MTAPRLNEDNISQVPALHLLQNMGYTYLSPQEALEQRGGMLNNVLLESILMQWLRTNNSIQYKGKEYPFTEGNILAAVQALKSIPLDGLVRTNELIYDLLSLGKSFQQAIDGDIKSFTMQYVDWKNPQNNVYHVTEEFAVERSGTGTTRRPDIVLFVNGIPFGVIECKAPHIKDPIGEAISQHIRNQKEDQIPELFIYSQIVLSLSKNKASYATTGTPKKFWSMWREDDAGVETTLQKLVNIQLTDKQLDKLFVKNDFIVREEREEYNCTINRKVTEQDKALYALCRPERLIELTYRYILYDKGEKKIARYQQYFCVQHIMERILQKGDQGKRRGGVVWHTQGSGKSLTMVFLAKSIALSEKITNYKIVLVTDRIDLDDQIYDTFHHCGKEVEQAKTGKDLAEMLKGNKQRIITTIIDKFDAAVGRHETRNESPDIFVLVDESHRGQYGSRHAKMQRVLPNACYIGFTGTPVMKKDKNTVEKFGGLIDSYTIDQAVEDKAVLPLLYEGRHVEQYVNKEGIDAWFIRITAKLSKDEAADLKKKFATTDQLNKTDQKIMAIAWDLSDHYSKTFQGGGLKGQLVTQDKSAALAYKKYLDEFGIVSSELLISGPDEREGETDIYKENKQAIQLFWKAMMQKYGSEKEYNKQIINSFKKAEHPEIIIVVDKLLTGFDAPLNTVLYITKKMKDHTLLQAIARVNRLHAGKDFGIIIDYRGILENLDLAFDLYNSLSEFDMHDIEGVVNDIQSEIAKLPQRYSVLKDTFKEVKNKKDEEEYELVLADEKLRDVFYTRLSSFARTLAIAFSSVTFHEETPPDRIEMYKNDVKFFSKLRRSVGQRYAEKVDFAEYEPKIQKLLDTHVGTGEVEKITPLVNIFDKAAFAKEVEKLGTTASKADTIAHRTAKTIHERMKEDPSFYRKFSELLEEAIRLYREKRILDNEYLSRVKEIQRSIVDRTNEDIPEKLKKYDVSRAYFGTLKDKLLKNIDAALDDDSLADLAIEIDSIIQNNRIVNWVRNIDIENKMRTEIDDYLLDLLSGNDITIDYEHVDEIINEIIKTAKVRVP